MNYGQEEQAAKYPTKKSESSEPEFSLIQNRFSKCLEQYSVTLNQIEDKLHSIFNLRTPDKQPTEGIAKNINDFISGTNEQITYLENNNFRLQKILDHLQKLTG